MWDDLATPTEQQTTQFYARGWWRAQTFNDDLAAAARDRGDHPAILAYENGELAKSLTYAGLAAMVGRFAGALTELGVGRRDVVTLYLPNLWQLTALYLACNRIGAVASPVIPTLDARELNYVLTSSRAVACVTVASLGETDYAARLAEAAPATLAHRVIIGGGDRDDDMIDFTAFFEETAWEERHPLADVPPPGADEPSLLLYTSGTTGQMKGVVHSHNTLYAAARGLAAPFGLTDDAVISIPHYYAHLAGLLIGAYMPILTGSTCVLQDENTDMDLLLDLIERHRISYLYAAPGYVVKMLAAQRERQRDVSSLRQFISGSAPIRPQLIADVQQVFGQDLGALWGMTETGCSTITRPADPHGWAARSDGRAFEWMQTRIRPDDEQAADGGPAKDSGADPAGHLLVRGAALCLGYLGQPELFAECLDDDGWFDTGDLARDDGRGGIKIVGRRVDLIRRANGQKVSTLEVESVLETHPGVAEVVLVGYPDPAVPGAELAAAVVVADGAPPTMDDLHAHLGEAGVAEVLWPDRMLNMRELPKNSVGKAQRGQLRKRLEIAASRPARRG